MLAKISPGPRPKSSSSLSVLPRLRCSPHGAYGCTRLVSQRFHERQTAACYLAGRILICRRKCQSSKVVSLNRNCQLSLVGGGTDNERYYLEVRTLLRKYEESNCILSGAARERLCLQEQEPRCCAAEFFLVTAAVAPYYSLSVHPSLEHSGAVAMCKELIALYYLSRVMQHFCKEQGAHFNIFAALSAASRLPQPQLLEGFTGAACASADSTSPAQLLSPHCLQSGLVATSNKHASGKVNARPDVP